MRSRDEQGGLRLVNLQPERVGDSFIPDNARVKLSIGDRASDGVRLSDRDVAIVPLDVRAVPGVVSADAVMFANSAQDSDHIVRVTPAGADSLVQIRSSSSPQRFRYRIDLPARGELRQLDSGDIAVSQADRRIGTIIKPTALDADRRPIPVVTSLHGDVLTLDMAHRGRDIRYPALLDPNYVDLLQYRWYRGGGNSATNVYWNFRTNDANKMVGFFGNYGQGNFGQTHGLYALTRGNQFLNGGQYGYWTFTAPGTTSVLQAEWTHLSHIAVHAGGPAPCIEYGLLYSSTAWRTRGTECANFTPAYRLSCWDCNDRDGFSYDPSVTGAQFGASVFANTIASISDYVGEVTLYLADPEDPSVTLTQTPPTGWSKTPAGTLAATANDPGLGVQEMTITNNGTVGNTGCLDGGPCPASMSRSADIPAMNLPDGNNTIAVTARDASYISHRDANGNNVQAKHEASKSTPVKLDRQPPTIETPSGSLFDARNGFVGPNQDYTLSVTSTDGAPTPALAQRSGAVSLSATLDGQPMTDGSKTEPCTRLEGSCALSINPILTGEEIAELSDTMQHTVLIKAVDALGHEQTESISFKVDKVAPVVRLTGLLDEVQGRTFTDDQGQLDAEIVDNEPEDYDADDEGVIPPPFTTVGAGMGDVVFRLDGQPVTTTARSCFSDALCDQARRWEWNLAAANTSNGSHEITVTATDTVGNETIETFDIDVQRATDQPARTAQLARTYRGAAASHRAGNAIAALGDLDDDGHADYLLGAPGASPNGRSSAGMAYIARGSEATSDIDLASPPASIIQVEGSAASARCGTSVASLGDVNGDGIDDMAIGCPGRDDLLGGLGHTTGRVYVIFGRSDPETVDLAQLGAGGFLITGPQDGPDLSAPLVSSRAAVFGERLQSDPGGSSAGHDVNGDGLADLVIGDSQVTQNGATSAGAAYVVYGKPDSGSVNVTNLGTQGFTIRGNQASGLTGYSAALVRDLDGDTLADVLIGSPGATIPTSLNAGMSGRAHVVFGSAESDDVNLATPSDSFITLTNGQTGDRFGVNVVGLGNTNLDDDDDIAIASHSTVLVIRRLPSSSGPISASDGYRVTGPTNDPGITGRVPGATVASAGDIDGDERSDLLVGYPDASTSASYTVLSPESSRTIALATGLPGQRGSLLPSTTQGSRSGAAIAGNSFQGYAPVSENAQVATGSPAASRATLESAAGLVQIARERDPEGPGVQPIDDDTSLAKGAADRATAAPLRFLVEGAKYPNWRSIRTSHSQFIMGHVKGGDPAGPSPAAAGIIRTATNQGSLFGVPFTPGGTFNKCGWLLRTLVVRPGGGPVGPRVRCRSKQNQDVNVRSVAQLINCNNCNGPSLISLRKGIATNDRDLINGRVPLYRNIRWNPKTRLEEGLDRDSVSLPLTETVDPPGAPPFTRPTRIQWRYISAKGDYVFIEADNYALGAEGSNSAFIRRKFLPPTYTRQAGSDGRSIGLCGSTRDTPTSSWKPVLKSRKAVNLPGKRSRVTWPKVCQLSDGSPYDSGVIE